MTGKVVFDGPVYLNDPIRMNADPVCLRQANGAQWQQAIVVHDGGTLQNVFVYVKAGLGNRKFDVPSAPVTLDQNGCRYHPHVFGVRVGQRVEVVNSDPTLHNVHVLSTNNAEFNVAQPVEGMKYTLAFAAKDVMVPFKCDVHGWMNAYAGVVDHPYFAVTGPNGLFELNSLPPGTYAIGAWHEKLGNQTQNVTIGKNETKNVVFRFKMM